MAEQASGNARDLMDPRLKEIERRQGVARNDFSDSAFPRVQDGAADVPFDDAAQQFVLFSTSHKGMFPRCRDPHQPAVLIFGSFASVEDANAHALHLREQGLSMNFQVNAARTWIVACRDEARVRDPSASEAQLARLQERRRVQAARDEAEFRDNVARQKAGSVPVAAEEAPASQADLGGLRSCTGSVPAVHLLRGQTHAVVLFLPDDSGDEYPEFAFQVLRCCADASDADRFVRNVAASRIADVDIHVVEANAWVFPQLLLTQAVPDERYRNEELNKVMATQRTSTDEAHAFDRANERPPQGLFDAPAPSEGALAEEPEELRGLPRLTARAGVPPNTPPPTEGSAG